MLVEKQTKPTDLQKFVVKLDDKDISDFVTDAHVYQEIFSPYWTANVIINDAVNLLMTLPIRPGSKITIEVETEMQSPADDLKEFEFVVSKISDKQLINTGTYIYTLNCVGETMLKQQTSRVSKGYQQKKVSEMIQNIVKQYLNADVEVTPTDTPLSLVVPNLTPLTACAWLSKMAVKDNAADYFFFQSDNNKFSFKSFEKMFSSEEESLPITLTNKHTSLTDNFSNPDIDYMLNMGRYYFEHFDSVANMATGFYKNTLLSYDLINKSWDKKVFTFGDDCKKDAEMKSWDSPLFENAENASISFKPKHPGSFGSSLGAMETADVWLTSRKSAVQKADQERLIAQIPGSVGCWKWLGKNIQVELPSQEEKTGEAMDKYRKGTYVVICVAHMFSKARYDVNLEMVKKRLNEKTENGEF